MTEQEKQDGPKVGEKWIGVSPKSTKVPWERIVEIKEITSYGHGSSPSYHPTDGHQAYGYYGGERHANYCSLLRRAPSDEKPAVYIPGHHELFRVVSAETLDDSSAPMPGELVYAIGATLIGGRIATGWSRTKPDEGSRREGNVYCVAERADQPPEAKGEPPCAACGAPSCPCPGLPHKTRNDDAEFICANCWRTSLEACRKRISARRSAQQPAKPPEPAKVDPYKEHNEKRHGLGVLCWLAAEDERSRRKKAQHLAALDRPVLRLGKKLQREVDRARETWPEQEED